MDSLNFLGGGGEMGARIRGFDWDGTPMGPPSTWPAPLRTALRILLTTQHPIFVFWGSEATCFYNDAYAHSLGPEQHPSMLGARGRNAWDEIWNIIGPQIETVMAGGGATWHEDHLVPITRGGQREDVYWTYSCGPIDDFSAATGVGGVMVITNETTRQVVAARRLQESEARLELALDAARMGAWEFDAATGQVVATERLHRLFDIEATGHVPLELWVACIHPEDRPRVAARRAAALAGTSDYDVEYRLDVAGGIRWVHARAHLIGDPGTGGKLIGIAEDVTERHRVHEALRTAEESLERQRIAERDRLRNLFEQAPGLIAVLDGPEHRFEFANKAHRELFGNRNVVGKTVRQAFPDIAEQGLYEIMDRVFKRGERFIATGLSLHLQPSPDLAPQELLLDFVFEPMHDEAGNVTGIFVEGLDVTERERAAAKLRESEKRLRAIYDGTYEYIGMLATDGTVLDCNRASLEFAGNTRDEVVGRLFWETPWFAGTPGASDTLRQGIERAAAGEFMRSEVALTRPSGEVITFDFSLYPVRNESGEVVLLVPEGRDISARKLVERALRDADGRKDAFLATLAHELRNPLAPIRTAAQILTAPTIDDEQRIWACQVIQRQVEHMAGLLDDLLDVARITNGKIELKREMVALASVVDAAIESARPSMDAKHHRLVVELPTATLLLAADPLRLSQVLSNLLINAAKYMDAGGRIDLVARVAAGRLAISVKDHGIGLAASSLTDIFNMFSQVDDARSRSEGGLGIGLALVKGLVELHGGTVEARSEGSGHGSEFVIELPLAAFPAVPDIDAPQPSTTPVARRLKVVVADDNKDAADSLAMLLEMWGHDVRVAHRGSDAITIAADFRPDFALLDIGMPDLDGYQIARRLRAEHWAQPLTLIAVSGWGQEADKRRALEAGFDRHLTKPLDPDDLELVFAQHAVSRNAVQVS